MKRFKTLFIACALLMLLNVVLPISRGPVTNPGGEITINCDMPPIDTY